MKLVAPGIAIAAVLSSGGCQHTRWGTVDGEDGMSLVREYRPMGADPKSAPTWVLRIDMSNANPGSYDQHWVDDSLDLKLGTAHGVVAGQLTCTPAADVFTCDGQDFDAKAGRVITFAVDATGRIGSPTQSDLAAYKTLR